MVHLKFMELKSLVTVFLIVFLLLSSGLPVFQFGFVSTVKAQEPQQKVFGNPVVWQDSSFEPYLMTNYPSKDYLTWNTTFGLYTMDKASYLMSSKDRDGVLQVSKSMFWLNTSDVTKVLNPDKILTNYVVLVQNNSCFKIRYAVTTDNDIVGWLTVQYDFFKDSSPKISVSYENISLSTFNIVWVLLPVLKYLEVNDSETVDYTTTDTVKSTVSKQDKKCRIGATSTPVNWTSWLTVLWDDSEGTSVLYAGTEKVWGGKGLTVVFPVNMAFIDPTVAFTTVLVTSVHTCPLDTHTFVIAYHDDTNDHFSFQIYDTNGTQILAETDVDTTSGGTLSYTSVGVSAFNSTTFVIGWHDKADQDATFAVYNKAGTLLSGPTDADTTVGAGCYSVQVSCFNSTHFVIGWYDYVDYDVTFSVYDYKSNLVAGPIDVDTDVGIYCYSVSVSTFNSTTFVIGWYDNTDNDATFAIYNSAGTQIGSTIDADTDAGASWSISVSTLNSTYFVIGWFDGTDQDATFAVYDSAGTLKTGPIDADTDVYLGRSVQVAALNSTAFVISWYDRVDFDLSYATYLSDGTAVAALTDIESWPTAYSVQFQYQSPCSQETGTGIKLYSDNWIIAYANTTTQADWKAFMPNGTAWDGTIPAGGDTTMPTYSGISTNTTVRNMPCNFSVTLSDETALANYTFGTNNTGTGTNESAVTISGLSYKANTTKTLNDTVGVVVQWEYWFADSSNNLNNTGIQSLTVTAYVQTDTFSEAVHALDSETIMKELGFQQSSLIVPSATGYFWKALPFQVTGTIKLYESTTIYKALAFLATGVINFFSSLSKAMGLGFQPTISIVPSSTNYFLKAIGFQPTGSIKAYDSSVMQKAIGFLSAGTINLFSTILKGIELGFTPSGSLYPVAYGTSGKETATILIDRFELAKLFDNIEMLKALSFRTTASINLFDSSAMSKAIGLLTTGTINVYSSILKGLGLAFQPTGTVKIWDSTSMLKALGFQVNAATKLYDSTTMLKALGFFASDTFKVLDSLSYSFEIWQYIPQNFIFDLTGIIQMFSGVSFNMAKGFSNYDLIHPSANSIQNKALGFSVDGLLRVFSDASIGIEKAFSNFAHLNPFSYLNENKAIGFNAYELPLFFDYLGMGKSIRITTFEFLNTELIRFSDALTMGKAIFIQFSTTLFSNLNIQSLMIPIGQIVLIGPGVPSSSFWKILAMFSIVMLMVSGVFLIEKQQKKKSQRDDGNNS